MRCIGPVLALAVLAGCPVFAQQRSAVPLVFSGTGPSETTVFTARDRWQVAWSGAAASVTIENAGGAPLVGAGGATGTLFIPAGGSYKVRIVPTGAAAGAWHLDITQSGAPGGTVSGDPATAYVPPDMSFAPGVAATATAVPPSTAAGGATPPPAASPAEPGVTYATPSPIGTGTPKLSESQTAAMVLIRGDNAQGTGFLIRTAAGSFVITNQHVIAANPHLQINTTAGDSVKVLGLTAASDRDLAMIPVQDNHYTYLQLAEGPAGGAQAGEAVITPGNSQGGGVMLTSNGTVLALGPQKVEISNPVYHGNSGGPIIDAQTGRVIGVVTEGLVVNVNNAIDKASFANHNSAITSSVRYFGMRLDNVPAWLDVPWNRFENETEFLRQFQERSKALDSLLNSTHDATEFGSYYNRDEKVRGAFEDFKADVGQDETHRVDAVRALVFNLNSLAETDLETFENPASFYSFDQEHAKQEAEYREALKKEIDSISNDVSRLTDLGRSF